MNRTQAASAHVLLESMVKEADRLESVRPTERLEHEQPRPAPLLRVTPRVHG